MNPNINTEYIDKIKIAFVIDSETVVRYDHSEKYKRHIDTYKPKFDLCAENS